MNVTADTDGQLGQQMDPAPSDDGFQSPGCMGVCAMKARVASSELTPACDPRPMAFWAEQAWAILMQSCGVISRCSPTA